MRSYAFSGKAGTPWMQAYTLQEQALLAAPLIVANPHDDGRDEQEVVVLLHDFSFKTPDQLLAGLTAGPAADAMAGHSGHGGMDLSWGIMAMDLNDIEYDAYLASDRTLADQEVAEVERGGRVRVRIIKGAAATAFTIDFGELEGESITVEGEDIVAVKGRRFPMNMRQRIDVWLMLPAEKRSFLILALREGAPQRTGIILEPRGAGVARVAAPGEQNRPVLDLELVLIPPMRSVTIALDADNAGQWAFDCHHPYHMAIGMMSTFGDRTEARA
ncbi:copper-resistance protein, CopA family [Aminobacter sp. MSH1]|uniref:multicopper oxidase domain-containing protein n=2 Tax=unclassified Aminobacter TaxID=2644704 RepID=UPI000D50488A|nr:multicopper oxidase domain-containing protein [Aminobacter sp. MSH1]AWC23701.1 copper-resistance protein, CopA family [Aminobacter sp. MSH1]